MVIWFYLNNLYPGLVAATFTVYQDFYSYRSGVYIHTSGSQVGGHAIKMLGFVSICCLVFVRFCLFHSPNFVSQNLDHIHEYGKLPPNMHLKTLFN